MATRTHRTHDAPSGRLLTHPVNRRPGRTYRVERLDTTGPRGRVPPNGVVMPVCLEPALEAEEAEEADEHRHHAGHDPPPRLGALEAREVDVHPEDPRDQRQWQEHDGEHGQDPEDVVL